METIIPLHDFTGYPDGKKVLFVANQETSVPSEYADMLRDKGHIEQKKTIAKKAK